MKLQANKLATLALAAMVITGMSSCNRKGCIDATATNYDENAKKDDGTCEYETSFTLSGDITEDFLVEAQTPNGDTINWTLSGGVHVKNGATITIEPGVTITADPNESVAYVLVEQGGMIMAEGTADAPIVFTSGKSNPARGDWGGIIINGKAPVNGGTTLTAEVGDIVYGGSDASDNSGSLRYVRVEYTGNAINDEKEHNGFTFNGVGSGTTAEYLQAYYGGDDGFEFFGGTLNAKWLISTGSKDDSFDWTYGWSGTGSNWIAEQEQKNGGEGDRGIEADNRSGANDATPFSNPTISKITLVGRSGTEAAGMKLREGTKGTFSNISISNFGNAVEIQHPTTVAGAAAGDLTLSNVTTSSVAGDFKVADAANSADSTSTATMLINAINGSGTGADSGWRSGWARDL